MRNNRNTSRNKENEENNVQTSRQNSGGQGNKPTGNKSKEGINMSQYAPSAQVILDQSTYNFSYPTGSKMDRLPAHDIPANISYAHTAFTPAGMMLAYYTPTFGNTFTDDPTTPLNVAAFQYYSALRATQNISSVLDAPDAMLYMIAISDLYATHAEMLRILGLLNMFYKTNTYYPKQVLTALGVDMEDLHTHQKDFVAYLNTKAQALNTFALPSTFPIVNRWWELNLGAVSDSADVKGQLYMYIPRYHLEYSETGGYLTYVKNPLNVLYDYYGATSIPGNTLLKYKDLIEYYDSRIDSLYNNGDFRNIASIVNFAYKDSLFTLPYVDLSYVTPIDKNYVMLSRIQNSVAVGDIYQYAPGMEALTYNKDTNNLIAKVVDYAGMAGGPEGFGSPFSLLYSTVAELTDPASMWIGTLESVIADSETFQPAEPQPIKRTVTQVGTQIINAFQIVTFEEVTGINSWQLYATIPFTSFLRMNDDLVAGIKWSTQIVELISNFDWHPMLQLCDYTNSSGTAQITDFRPLCDFDVWTSLSYERLREMHRYYVLASYNVVDSSSIYDVVKPTGSK